MAPTWSKKDRLWSLCFDDMHLDPSANIDRIADELVGPASNGNLLVVGTHTYEVFSTFFNICNDQQGKFLVPLLLYTTLNNLF